MFHFSEKYLAILKDEINIPVDIAIVKIGVALPSKLMYYFQTDTYIQV